ncbi:unnamed protein product [Parajaminaea phylloscopi]
MYNSYQQGPGPSSGPSLGPPPGLNRQQPQHSPWQTFTPAAAPPPGGSTSASNSAASGVGASNSNSNPRSSTRTSAIPIMRPDGSAPSSPAPERATVAASTAGGNGGFSKAAAGAAVFVPKSGSKGSTEASTQSQQQTHPPTADMRSLDLKTASQGSQAASTNAFTRARGAGAPVFTPSGRSATHGYDSDAVQYDPSYMGAAGPPGSSTPTLAASEHQQQRQFNPYEHLDYEDTSSRQSLRQPLLYHLQAPPLPHTSNLHPHHLAQAAYFMSPALKEELFRRNEAINASCPSVQELGGTQTRPPQPSEVHVYRDLVPLEPDSSGPLPYGTRGNPITIGGVPTQLLPRHLLPVGPNGLVGGLGMGSLSNLPVSASGGPLAPSAALGKYPTEVHRATCTLDGKPYVLRRIVGFNLTRERERALETVERWRRLRCPGVVNVREAFTSWRWGSEPSIVFVYDYHSMASTLFAEHLLPKPPRVDPRTGRMERIDDRVPERTLWSYLVQIATALRSIHRQGLAARCIEAGKILKTGKNRVRINCCSVLDVLSYDPLHPPTSESAAQEQLQDLRKLGALILVLACLNPAAAHADHAAASLEHLSRTYSRDLTDIIHWLLGSEEGKDVDALLEKLAPRMADELSSAQSHGDLLEEGLSKELENARLVRLLCKMGFINERPEFERDPAWSSTGERYVVSLFRDYLFHSLDDSGPGAGSGGPPKPLLDLSHVLSSLNRLDAGSQEKIMLSSRDEQTSIVVSYKEVRNAIDSAFSDLSR